MGKGVQIPGDGWKTGFGGKHATVYTVSNDNVVCLKLI